MLQHCLSCFTFLRLASQLLTRPLHWPFIKCLPLLTFISKLSVINTYSSCFVPSQVYLTCLVRDLLSCLSLFVSIYPGRLCLHIGFIFISLLTFLHNCHSLLRLGYDLPIRFLIVICNIIFSDA